LKASAELRQLPNTLRDRELIQTRLFFLCATERWVEQLFQMATIKAIEGRSIHQIQSGQVIVDLYSVVKELVENSLDAGATSIEIRFKNHGLDNIEVQDNGKGIAPEDFETIALKHYTSKLSSYEDLTSLDTFGFRGEALSSLCALSNFHIVTARADDGPVGKKLEFEASGKLRATSVVAAQKGTTVSVENLFFNLPVRRKELEKNIKREYTKVVNQLHAYACISVGVRLAVSNQMPKGKRVAVFSTQANTTTKENIANVFGAKTLSTLVKLDLRLHMEPSKGPSTQGARNWSTLALDRSMEVLVQGHMSKPVFGEGRQVPDRQMFFVNSRPCLLQQVSKAFNEVYKSFNTSQSPFIFANLVMDTNAYDVNVSPDKRSIMLHDQTALLESLKTALTELFETTDQTMPQSQLQNRRLPSYKPLSIQRTASTEDESNIAGDGEAGDSSDSEDESATDTQPLRQDSDVAIGTPPSLIQNWMGRDTEPRKERPASKRGTPSLSMDKQKPITEAPVFESPIPDVDELISPQQAAEDSAVDLQDQDTSENKSVAVPLDQPNPMGSPYDDLFSQRPTHLPRPVQDFNILMDRRRGTQTFPMSTADHAEPLPREVNEVTTEHLLEIPAIAPSSQKATPGPIQNAFDRMRPKRTPLQTAEITVGDKTTTTVIGSSPPYKRRRVHQPSDLQSIAQFGGSPLLARGLRTFAAPGSQMHLESSAVPEGREQASQSSEEETDDHVEDSTARRIGNGEQEADMSMMSDVPVSDPLNTLIPAPADDDQYDEDYVDEDEKKAQEDERVARLIQEAELAVAQPSEDNLRRVSQALKNGGNRKQSTLQLAQYVSTTTEKIEKTLAKMKAGLSNSENPGNQSGKDTILNDEIDDDNAEARLSLSVSKTDFGRMLVIGQFNLGFILAVRPALSDADEDELFIIDQHAADEKYNYERLQRTVTLQNQRLVRPKPLDLTAIEEEIILSNKDALKANGFEIETTSYTTDDESAGNRCRLITLPISGEKTFDLSDLEELLHLLSEAPAGSSEVPRPRKVQKMLAMRACRSSIMVGKTLTTKQMLKVVRHMGEMEKPWNCPHGRPTMRHLAGLGSWSGWQEGEVIEYNDDRGGAVAERIATDWKAWLQSRK
jgi:DNA mismatch repair protein PMS2